MTVMEPRVAERRKSVSEDRARKRLRWILVVIALAAAVFGSLWLIRSPILSIRQIDVTGAQFTDPRAVLHSLEMGIGTPTIDIDGAAITMSILDDPWIEAAKVEILWPGSILIDVTERTPVAPVLAGNQWVLVATDGGVIKMVPDPGPAVASVAIDQGPLDPGDVISDPLTIGALVFIGHLGEQNLQGASIRTDGEGLTALVAGHAVRLGRPVDMAEKATVLEALLSTGIESGASIDLIAPLRPAVTNPQPVPEVEE